MGLSSNNLSLSGATILPETNFNPYSIWDTKLWGPPKTQQAFAFSDWENPKLSLYGANKAQLNGFKQFDATSLYGTNNSSNKIDNLARMWNNPQNRNYVKKELSKMGVDLDLFLQNKVGADPSLVKASNINNPPAYKANLNLNKTNDLIKLRGISDRGVANGYVNKELDAAGLTLGDLTKQTDMYVKPGNLDIYSSKYNDSLVANLDMDAKYYSNGGDLRGAQAATKFRDAYTLAATDPTKFKETYGVEYKIDPNISYGENALNIAQIVADKEGIQKQGWFDNMTGKDWLDAGMQGLGLLMNGAGLYMSYTANQDARERWKDQKAYLNTNLANQAKLINNRIDAAASAASQMNGNAYSDDPNSQYQKDMAKAKANYVSDRTARS